ncbi:MAG: hypothetical protein A2340_04340 [Lentisphaerae bacterium RIFOXYB12_FULL_60_10]|nr:MAG: hypothetical protein A2340_04340 [Lentisphaerae bacterium RIFOXYB12_FULL_60_10]
MNRSSSTVPVDPHASERFFRPVDWAAFWTALALSFAVYAYTLAPTVSLEDSGELAVASDYLGVPHPPGYPIWTMLTWFFTKIFAFVTFRGQPNPAWSVGLFSAICGALAAGFTALLISRSGFQLLQQSRDVAHKKAHEAEDLICWVSGVSCSLLFAFSPVMWSQSVIVEVYSLNALFLVLVFLLSYWWMCRPSDHLLYLTAFIFGLGLTNYQVLLLAALPLVIIILLRDTELFRDFVILGIPFLAVLLLIKFGQLEGIVHPLHPSGFIYLALNIGGLVLGYFLLPRGRTVALTFLLVEAGLAFYAYMPIVSDLLNPPMNWGYPRTWEGFKHAVSRGQYEKIIPTDVFSRIFIDQVGSYLTDLRAQFTLPVTLLGFLPFTVWTFRAGKTRFNALVAALPLCIVAVAVVTLEEMFFPGGIPVVTRLYKSLIALVIVLLGVGALLVILQQAGNLLDRLRNKVPSTFSERAVILLVFVGVALLGLIYEFKLGKNLLAILSDKQAAAGAMASAQFIQSLGILLLMILPPLVIIAMVWLMSRPKEFEFRISMDFVSERWVIATLAGFFAMSLVLIALASPKGDIQDNFIQRVKFISSHALFAFWIGYGLVYGLSFVDTLFKGNQFMRIASLTVAFALPLIPIHHNYHNRELIRVSGGAEQNNHDFGWQFGNYQLRGADAIFEELDPEEEPIPNPEFPREMGTNAVFFGGTDPGRFVPTYMIYSARVREDVFLITQNALADNTYMSVMRDLYGDKIWIPAQPDSAKAFQIYVEEVRSGKRQANADLKIEGGRVQVSGALGVMEINGVLCEMIFNHNKFKHDFFVEESYVIRWMYPYLEPHGLIMKINREPFQFTQEMANNDRDFWDWYTRRLTADERFRRDVVARKSFSKLRSALGGLYTFRNRLDDAEQAFIEARLLYPLSPEANFRMVQEVYLRQGRLDQSERLMKEFGEQDPANVKIFEFLGQLQGFRRMDERMRELEALIPGNKLDINGAVELAEIYLQAGQAQRFQEIAMNVMGDTNLPSVYHFRMAQLLDRAGQMASAVQALDACIDRIPPDAPHEIFIDMARIYAKAQRYDRMAVALKQYLRRVPTDWKAWMDLSAIQLASQQTAEASRSLEQAIRCGGQEAMNVIYSDGRFAPIRDAAASRSQNLFGLPLR